LLTVVLSDSHRYFQQIQLRIDDHQAATLGVRRQRLPVDTVDLLFELGA
jgi:hypothetical protein